MRKPTNNITCWVVTEGIAGTENQCIGIAEALGVDPLVRRVRLRWPWSLLSPYLGLEQAWTFSPALEPPWPDLLIASGRKSVAAARYIKNKSGGKTYTAQIQDPRIRPDCFDLVAVPEHDRLRGANVMVTKATPNRISAERLAKAREQFDLFSSVKSPRVAVLIGGSSKAYRMGENLMRRLAGQLADLDAGLMITASRRTGEANRKILEQALAGKDAYIWDGTGDNPYFGLLGWADYILVTADSSSMLSEAASTGKPVYMIGLEGGSPKFERLHENLKRHGAVRVFSGKLEEPWSYTPFKDAAEIAERIADSLY